MDVLVMIGYKLLRFWASICFNRDFKLMLRTSPTSYCLSLGEHAWEQVEERHAVIHWDGTNYEAWLFTHRYALYEGAGHHEVV